MDATPEVYQAGIARTRYHIARIDAMRPSRDGFFAWDQAQERRARLVRQLAALELALARAERLWAAAQEQGAGTRLP